MPPERAFTIEKASAEKHPSYKDSLLQIVNDIERRVRVINPDAVLQRETHIKKLIDARKEVAEYEEVRKDIAESFGVSLDADHTYIHAQGEAGAIEQRALRAFFILIDTFHEENFYSEGRIDHNALFRNLIPLLKKIDENIDFETIAEGMDTDPPRFLVFKGFLSTKAFREVSDAARKVLETPIFDSDGRKIDTAEEWFVTGHNVPEPKEMIPKS
ncbi:MAG: hypothetical protein G01um101472_505 [Parcubacteria group bacterium Gr01-1014_72]|nr:MAG: hypothetical protein G01um101472_505 [Parcubacteria group bacterium Gr01-1014_72]